MSFSAIHLHASSYYYQMLNEENSNVISLLCQKISQIYLFFLIYILYFEPETPGPKIKSGTSCPKTEQKTFGHGPEIERGIPRSNIKSKLLILFVFKSTSCVHINVYDFFLIFMLDQVVKMCST